MYLITSIKFANSTLAIINTETNQQLIPLRIATLALGVTWQSQVPKLAAGRYTVHEKITRLPGEPRAKRYDCLDKNDFVAWLKDLNPQKIAVEARANVLEAQWQIPSLLASFEHIQQQTPTLSPVKPAKTTRPLEIIALTRLMQWQLNKFPVAAQKPERHRIANEFSKRTGHLIDNVPNHYFAEAVRHLTQILGEPQSNLYSQELNVSLRIDSLILDMVSFPTAPAAATLNALLNGVQLEQLLTESNRSNRQ